MLDPIYKSCYNLLYRNINSQGPCQDLMRKVAFKALNLKYRAIKLHVNNSCNLRCKNCYCDFSKEKSLSLEEIRDLIDQFKPVNNNFDFHLLGGEPFLREDICDIITYAKRRFKEVVVFTNGTLINRGKADKIKKSGTTAVIVTLHSSDTPVHDDITQTAGSWLRTVEGIKNLVNAGLPTYTFTVLMALNRPSLTKTENFARSLGAKTMYFPYIKQHEKDELSILKKEELQETICWVFNKSKQYNKKLSEILSKRPKMCSAFVSSINIKADGTITPCPFLDLDLGNIRKDDIYSLLQKAHKNKLLLDFLSIPKECMQCSLVEVCGGGCKAHRFNVHGDTASKDHNCRGPYMERIPAERMGEYLPYVF